MRGSVLWDKYHNGDNLLFKEDDFRKPNKSRLLRELWTLRNFEVRALVGHLLLASRVPQDQVPRLSHLLEGGLVRTLDSEEEQSVQSLMGVTRTVRKSQLGKGSDPVVVALTCNDRGERNPNQVERAGSRC